MCYSRQRIVTKKHKGARQATAEAKRQSKAQPALLEDEHVLGLVWDQLSNDDDSRAALFFTSRAVRAAVLKLSRLCTYHAVCDPSNPAPALRSALRTLLAVKAADVGIHLDTKAAEPDPGQHLPSRDKVVLATREELLGPLSDAVEELSFRNLCTITPRSLSAIGSDAPALTTLTLELRSMPVLPAPSAFAHLTELILSQPPGYVDPAFSTVKQRASFWSSVAAYMPQLEDTLHVLVRNPVPTNSELQQLLTHAGPATLKMSAFGIFMPLSDDLLQLLSTHLPNITHLTVSHPPSAPLQQPCSFESVTFQELESIGDILNIPASVERIEWDLVTLQTVEMESEENTADDGTWHCTIHKIQRSFSQATSPLIAPLHLPGQEANALIADKRSVEFTHEDVDDYGMFQLHLHAPPGQSASATALQRMLQAASKFESINCLILNGWDWTVEQQAVLTGLPESTYQLTIHGRWQRTTPPLATLLSSVPGYCFACNVSTMFYGDDHLPPHALSVPQIRSLLSGLPRDRTEDTSVEVLLDVSQWGGDDVVPNNEARLQAVQQVVDQVMASGKHPHVEIVLE